MNITENNLYKHLESKDCNFIFNKEDGTMVTWGKTLQDNPIYAPFPFILDIEITSICNGGCPFCYKSNTSKGHNMSFNTFKSIIDKMPWLTQIALGADATGYSNPDMIKMMEYIRSKGIIPNATLADVDKNMASKLSKVAGAIAISVYKHKGFDTAFNSVKNLHDAGQKQINLHYMISESTYDDAFKICEYVKSDERLKNVNAIVFLSLKQKGRGKKHERVSQKQYTKLVEYCLNNEIKFGFDSCSAPNFLKSVENHPNFEQFYIHSEDCESTLFSSYINEYGEFYPCSFTEKWIEGGWDKGIDILSFDNFNEVWYHPKTVKFRENLLSNTEYIGNKKCRKCPAYNICI